MDSCLSLYKIYLHIHLNSRLFIWCLGRPAACAFSISGQDEEEVRKQKAKQRSLLRRLYMDIERQQVKEYKKMKAHAARIAE